MHVNDVRNGSPSPTPRLKVNNDRGSDKQGKRSYVDS